MAAAAEIVLARSTRPGGALDPEFALLLACCGGRSDVDLDSLLASPVNWDFALKLADHHRVLPAVFAALSGRSDVPASIRSALKARFHAYVRKTLQFSAELTGILQKFEDRGLEVLSDSLFWLYRPVRVARLLRRACGVI